MIALWQHYWPVVVAALAVGVVAGAFAFRARGRFATVRRRRAMILAGGVALVFAMGAVWHGPAGTAARFAGQAEQIARTTLDHYEMSQVDARLQRQPMHRVLVLSGPADDFQRGELVRIMSDVPGVASVRWPGMQSRFQLPLLLEAELIALLGFGLGVLLSYLVELRRRARAEWRW